MNIFLFLFIPSVMLQLKKLLNLLCIVTIRKETIRINVNRTNDIRIIRGSVAKIVFDPPPQFLFKLSKNLKTYLVI